MGVASQSAGGRLFSRSPPPAHTGSSAAAPERPYHNSGKSFRCPCFFAGSPGRCRSTPRRSVSAPRRSALSSWQSHIQTYRTSPFCHILQRNCELRLNNPEICKLFIHQIPVQRPAVEQDAHTAVQPQHGDGNGVHRAVDRGIFGEILHVNGVNVRKHQPAQT